MNDELIEQHVLLEAEVQPSAVPRSAEDVAKSILAWAKENNLFSKAPTDDGIDLGSADLSALPARMQSVADISGILRKRAINLVAYSNEQRRVTIFTNGKVSKA
jgi:hypothetical protein